MDSKDTPNPFEGIPVMTQTPEQAAWFKKHVTENDYNAFCVDCKTGNATHANMITGTFVCAACAEEHKTTFPLLNRIKAITETFDEHQLRLLAVSGGNNAFVEWMKLYAEYAKQDTIAERYKTDAALYFATRLNHRAREVHFQIRAPPTSDLERAKFAADDAKAFTNEGLSNASKKLSALDEEYKISDQTKEAATKAYDATAEQAAKAGKAVMGWFSKSK